MAKRHYLGQEPQEEDVMMVSGDPPMASSDAVLKSARDLFDLINTGCGKPRGRDLRHCGRHLLSGSVGW
ncbi:unnamed protein product [Vitrella brassicaformis CCMP3155]|uniref:Uncharacterized protein n=1 Tax=Vitrella brassicaformis (strain CCMP3155) TaxID=1169540 RepID=A0A0G4H2Q7_VITBC|nr:unnamed protein product [Vitrella brassicaformis CCMP3155]|eukprot:CEM37961.1 unnamed protein product [Vitrella brassicaformis CCMP3155]